MNDKNMSENLKTYVLKEPLTTEEIKEQEDRLYKFVQDVMKMIINE